MSKRCPLCENMLIEMQDMSNLRLFDLSPNQILMLKHFYINHTGDMELKKLERRITEEGLK